MDTRASLSAMNRASPSHLVEIVGNPGGLSLWLIAVGFCTLVFTSLACSFGSAESFTLNGRVVSIDGKPIAAASVTSQSQSSTTDDDGWFRITSGPSPQWVTVEHPEFLSRTRAAAPNSPTLFRLTPDDGQTISLHFVGDTMFGRRFYDLNQDGDTSDGLLSNANDLKSHSSILDDVAPLLENADLTVINLESALSDNPERYVSGERPADAHPDKVNVIVSAGTAIEALRDAGVDLIGLSNNHFSDLLDPGVELALGELEAAGFPSGRGIFGGGLSEDDAWRPATVTVKGQSVAFIGCTAVTGENVYDISYVASDQNAKGGAAKCTAERLSREVMQAGTEFTNVIVLIHGGKEYQRAPTEIVKEMTEVARASGATLVVNHHPHVVGGLDWDGTSLVAWSLGNFVFDQNLWPTFESYLLSVHLRKGKVIRAYIEPLMLEEYRPKGITGELADFVTRRAVSRGNAPFITESGAAESDFEGVVARVDSQMLVQAAPDEGEIIPIPTDCWVSAFSGLGSIRLGRDLIWSGTFEDEDVDSDQLEGSLWNLDGVDKEIQRSPGNEDSSVLRLKRSAKNYNDVVSGPQHRIPVEPGTDISLVGVVQAKEGGSPNLKVESPQVTLQLSWYSELEGPSYDQTLESFTIPVGSDWAPIRLDATVPPDAIAVGVFLRLAPPDFGYTTADFEDINLIAWSDDAADFSRRYDFMKLTGNGSLTFSKEFLPGAISNLTEDASPSNCVERTS